MIDAPMLATFHSVIALSGLLVGLVLLPTPVPLGLPLIAGSLALMVAANPRARRRLRGLRGRSRRLDARLYLLEARARHHIRPLAGPLRATRPPHRFRVRRRRGLHADPD
ncbi:MAG: hypothetical protein V2J24_18425 [Pseudomonadales bacterium]|jgi:hypothetical protein|nr:hypothetical protein [Pseudomonadales bacterium]